MEVLCEHLCQGWLEGYLLTGRHGLFATYEAFAMVVGVDDHPAREVARSTRATSPGGSRSSSLNILLTSTCWRNDHNGFSHQGPGLIDTSCSLKGTVARIYLPPDANCLLSVADHCFRSRDYVNLIVIDKQPQLQYLDLDDAPAHCARGGVDLGLGRQRRTRSEPRRRPRLRRRHPDDGGARRGVAPARALPRPARAVRQRRRPHGAATRPTSTPTA